MVSLSIVNLGKGFFVVGICVETLEVFEIGFLVICLVEAFEIFFLVVTFVVFVGFDVGNFVVSLEEAKLEIFVLDLDFVGLGFLVVFF